jgi:hypothetical protein
MAEDPRIAEQAVHISEREHQIEVIGAIVLLDQAELAREILGLVLHERDLLLAQPLPTPATRLCQLVIGRRRYERFA